MEKKDKTQASTTTVRLPPELHAKLKEAASEAGHSMNAEIIERLSEHIKATELREIAKQNQKLLKMVQRLVDTLC
jgi:predicted DNA-binding protein